MLNVPYKGGADGITSGATSGIISCVTAGATSCVTSGASSGPATPEVISVFSGTTTSCGLATSGRADVTSGITCGTTSGAVGLAYPTGGG